MMPVGILVMVFGYAVTYSGIMGLTRGVDVGVIASLKPGFVAPKAIGKTVDTSVGGAVKKALTPGGILKGIENYVNPLGPLIGENLPGQK